MSTDAKQRWFCELVQAGLQEQIFGSAELMKHATPEVLAEHLPAPLMAEVLQAALSAGSMTTDGMLKILTPELCVKHLPGAVLWRCVVEAAAKSGLAEDNGEIDADDPRRKFMRRVLDQGLDGGLLSPQDLLRYATPEVLAEHLPTPVKAKLLTESLRANALNPQLIVDVVGIDALVEYAPPTTLWACVEEVGERALDSRVRPPSADKPDQNTLAKAVRRATSAGGNVQTPATSPFAAKSGLVNAEVAGPFDADGTGEWVGAEDYEVVEEDDLVALTDDVLSSVTGSEWPPPGEGGGSQRGK